jgi:NTE family protein
MLGRWTIDTSPVFIAFDLAAQIFSPYDLNPHRANPLREILAECIDFKRVAGASIKLFVTATNVRTSRGRVFHNTELTPEVLLASACLPTLFQAIEIDGESYWDGGYVGNPTITSLVRECRNLAICCGRRLGSGRGACGGDRSYGRFELSPPAIAPDELGCRR